MEVAGDEPGAGPVDGREGPGANTRGGLVPLVVVLAVLALVGAFFAARAWQAGGSDDAERYAAVQKAASRTTVALLNVDYRDTGKTIKAVRDTATADFAKQIANASDGLVKLTKDARSVMTGEVIWTGVVRLEEDEATVIVATEGEVRNAQTGDKPAARNFRLKLDLVRDGDRWRTSALDFVQVPL